MSNREAAIQITLREPNRPLVPIVPAMVLSLNFTTVVCAISPEKNQNTVQTACKAHRYKAGRPGYIDNLRIYWWGGGIQGNLK